jgi:MFS family permease
VLAACALGVGLGSGFFQPAFGGIVPLVVEHGSLTSANALIGAARNASYMLGPAVAGLAYVPLGPGGLFAVNALSFLVSAAFLWRARPRALEPAERQGTFRELGAGLRYVASVKWLWVTIALFAVFLMLVLAPFQVLMPKLVQEHFDRGVQAYGLLSAFFGGGMVAGTLLFGQWNPRRNRGRLSYVIWAVTSLLVIGIVLAPWFALAVAVATVRGLLVGVGQAVWETMLMQRVPENMLSRVISLDWFGSVGLMPIGFAGAAAVSDAASPGMLLSVGALISAIGFAAVLPARWLREVDE